MVDSNGPTEKLDTQADHESRLAEALEIEEALTRAHGDVIRRHRAFDIPLVIWEDGRVQLADPHSMPIPDADLDRMQSNIEIARVLNSRP